MAKSEISKKTGRPVSRRWSAEQKRKFQETMRAKRAAEKKEGNGSNGSAQFFPLALLPDRPARKAITVRASKRSNGSDDERVQLALQVCRLLSLILEK